MSLAELEALATGAAVLFAKQGIQRGSRVLLMARPGLELIAGVFALFKLGAPPVVIDPGMGLRGFLRCVRHAEPEALVGIPLAQAVSRFFPKSFRSVKSRVTLNARFLDKARAASEQKFSPAQTSADELAAILFTSGSTGPAKGVRYTHGMFEAQVAMLREHFAIEPGEVDLPMLPIFALFNPALGMTTVVPEMNPSRPAKANPSKIAAAIHKHKVTNSFGSPVLWTKITDYCESHGQTLPSLRRVLMAGAPCPPELIRRLKAIMPNGEVHTPYGATEVLPVSSISGTEILEYSASLTEQGKGTCVGLPLPGVTVRIIAIEDARLASLSDTRELPQGEIGEILVTGPTVTRKYDGLPEATAAAKVHDGETVWHRMGDLGYFDDEGRLWFCGRKAERVETEQGTLYTDCVEGVFNTHPDVFRTALLGLGERGKQIPVLAIEPVTWPLPLTKKEKNHLIRELTALGAKHDQAVNIRHFLFNDSFPVDVRHNAKIHRISMAAKPMKDFWTTDRGDPEPEHFSRITNLSTK